MRLFNLQPILSPFLLAALLFGCSIYCISGGYQEETAALKRDSGVPFPNDPEFSVQPDNPNFPVQEWPATITKLRVAFDDALRMAGVACVLFNPWDETYRRYFAEEDAKATVPQLIRSIICNIAGIDNPSAFTPQQILMRPVIVDPKYKKLSIVAGRSGLIPNANQPTDPGLAATTFTNLRSGWKIPGKDDDDAITQVYLRAFDFPSLRDIFNHRKCAGLDSADSGKMTSLGATGILHEMLHWTYLVRTAENQEIFDDLVTHWVIDQEDPDAEFLDERDYVDDYHIDLYPEDDDKPIYPTDGYGPVNTAQLRVNNEGDSWKNADNYRWYIVSKFWDFLCTQKTFATQTDQLKGDSMVPIGSKGQVPYPDELPPA